MSADDDGIETTIRSYARTPRWRIRIDDELFEFPDGTTREHAESVLEEAKLVHLRRILIGQLKQLAGPRR